MIIAVLSRDEHVFTRPDTSLGKSYEDFYVPEFIDSVSFCPVLFARVCKAGRSVAVKFADRYYDGINYGILLYPGLSRDDGPYGIACSSCLDRTTILPAPLYNKVTLGREGNVFRLEAGNKELFSFNRGTAEMLEKAVGQVTGYVHIRIGDVIAIELDDVRELCRRSDGRLHLTATWCDNLTTDFSIIF